MKPIDQLSDDEFSRQTARAVRALPDVPPALQRAALDLFAARSRTVGLQSLAEQARSVLRQISAVLTFDSWAAPALAAGMRAGRSPTRHLLFSAQGRDIDLRISPQSPGSDSYGLAGQILGPDETGRLELRAETGGASGPVVATALDALGEFRFDGLARGAYSLTLLTGSEQIALPPIEVGFAAGESAP